MIGIIWFGLGRPWSLIWLVVAYSMVLVDASSIPDWDMRLKLPYSTTPCENDADCMYLGICELPNHKCVCDPGFKGSHCHELDLLPTDDSWGFRDPERPSWGGNVIKENGTYHLFASYMANKCELKSYGTNSAVLRATAETPEGPYKYQETVLPPFHHGTIILRDPLRKRFAFWSDGIDIPSKVIHDCVHNPESKELPKRVKLDPSAKSGLFKFGGSPHDVISVSVSSALDSRNWTQKVVMKTNLLAGMACNRTNPSPLLLSDGSLILAVRTTYCSPAGRPDCPVTTNCQHIFITRAPSLDADISDDLANWQRVKQLEASEDPFLWMDSRGRYHMLVHSKRACGIHDSGSCGLVASSLDSKEWIAAGRPAYSGIVKWRNTNTTSKVALLQRPKILFAEDGHTPLFLICGLRKSPSSSTHTLFIPFNVSQNARLGYVNSINRDEYPRGKVDEDAETSPPSISEIDFGTESSESKATIVPSISHENSGSSEVLEVLATSNEPTASESEISGANETIATKGPSGINDNDSEADDAFMPTNNVELPVEPVPQIPQDTLSLKSIVMSGSLVSFLVCSTAGFLTWARRRTIRGQAFYASVPQDA